MLSDYTIRLLREFEKRLEELVPDFEIPSSDDPNRRNRKMLHASILCSAAIQQLGVCSADPDQRPDEIADWTAKDFEKRIFELSKQRSAASMLSRLAWLRSPHPSVTDDVVIEVLAEILGNFSLKLQWDGERYRGDRIRGSQARAQNKKRRDRELRQAAEGMREFDPLATEKEIAQFVKERYASEVGNLSDRRVQDLIRKPKKQ